MKLLLVVGKNAILVVYDKLSKITYFVATIEEMSVERLASLFRNNIWKLYRLSESVILDWTPQFVVELTKKLNRMLSIEIKLSMAFHLQIDRQTEHMN